MKDLVPSIGSSTQMNSASSRSLPNSSPMMPWAGKRFAISCRIAASAARSAAVTGDRSGLSSTAIGRRKYGRIASPAASARSIARARNWSVSTTFLLFQAFQIGDHVGAVLHLGEPRKRHLGALGEFLRLGEPDIQLVRIPFLALMREQRLGKLVIRHAGDIFFHGAEQCGADLIGLALVKGMALQTDLGDLLAMLGIGLRQGLRDRLGCRRLAGSRGLGA